MSIPLIKIDTSLSETKREDRIYLTAAKLINAKGFDATSMSEIADAVKLTKAGLYYYVKGKKELLFKIMGVAMDLLERYVITPAREVDDPEERLRTIVSHHASLLTGIPVCSASSSTRSTAWPRTTARTSSPANGATSTSSARPWKSSSAAAGSRRWT